MTSPRSVSRMIFVVLILSSPASRVIAQFSFDAPSATDGVKQSTVPTTVPSAEVTLESLEPLHRKAAQEYAIYSDIAKTHALTLQREPLSQWVNVNRAGGQLGHVFVWMDGETPAAIGGIFSFPWGGVMTNRRVVHEMHAIAPQRLGVDRPGYESRWQPKTGLQRLPIPGVDDSAHSMARFNLVLRHVATRFSGHTIDMNGERWPLRLLPKPLIVYPVRHENSVGFGAIMGMMGDVGSDLECGLVIEAASDQSDSPRPSTDWRFAPIRMTDQEAFLFFNDQPIWQSVRTETDTRFFDTPQVYFRFQDRTIKLDPSP